MTNEFKDTAGNTLRETSSGWEILQKGVGWREFVGFTILLDGRVLDTMPKENSAIEWVQPAEVASKELTQKQLEDDLFRHYAGIALDNIMKRVRMESVEATPPRLAECAADCAEAMIEKLKGMGRL